MPIGHDFNHSIYVCIYIYGYGGVLKLGYPQIILKLNHPYIFNWPGRRGPSRRRQRCGNWEKKFGNFETKTPQDPIREETMKLGMMLAMLGDKHSGLMWIGWKILDMDHASMIKAGDSWFSHGIELLETSRRDMTGEHRWGFKKKWWDMSTQIYLYHPTYRRSMLFRKGLKVGILRLESGHFTTGPIKMEILPSRSPCSFLDGSASLWERPGVWWCFVAECGCCCYLVHLGSSFEDFSVTPRNRAM